MFILQSRQKIALSYVTRGIIWKNKHARVMVLVHDTSSECALPNIYVSWSTSELRVRLAPLNRFKPSSKIFYWPTKAVLLLWIFYVYVLSCVCARLFICALWSPAGKGLTSWLSFVVSAVSLSLSHWYPGSGVVLDCIDSWSLHPYLHINVWNFFEIPVTVIKL